MARSTRFMSRAAKKLLTKGETQPMTFPPENYPTRSGWLAEMNPLSQQFLVELLAEHQI
jgi:hypothetical protein